MKQPGPDHPITLSPAAHRVRVSAAGTVIADSRHALVLKEASYPPVYYIPRDDADLAALVRSLHTSHCPYKGDASYFAVRGATGLIDNAVWSYEAPYPAVAAIAGHLAFYPDKVEIEELPA